jgi:hypothetical protein
VVSTEEVDHLGIASEEIEETQKRARNQALKQSNKVRVSRE